MRGVGELRGLVCTRGRFGGKAAGKIDSALISVQIRFRLRDDSSPRRRGIQTMSNPKTFQAEQARRSHGQVAAQHREYAARTLLHCAIFDH